MVWSGLPWEGLILYFLLLLSAGLLGWVPFYLLQRISLVDQVDLENVETRREPTGSRVACYNCGRSNEASYTYCGQCGGKLFTDGS